MQQPRLDSQVSTERIFTRSMPAACTAEALSSSISSLISTMTLPSKSFSFSSETRPMMRSRSGSMMSPASMIDETAGEVAGVSRLERRVSQTLAGAVRRDEVLEHGETLAEVGLDGRLDDLAGRLGHEAAHTGELTDLLLRTTGAGVGHDVDRVHGSFLVRLLHVVEHLV